MRDPLATPLPLRYERFITEYLKDQNASAAARRAGYTPTSCARQGSRLLRRPEIQARLRGEFQGLMAQSRASARDLMEERCKIAYFRGSKMFDAEGRLLDFKEMDAQTFDCLRISVRVRKGEPEYYIRPPNRDEALRALERLNDKLDRQDERHAEWEERARREAEAKKPEPRVRKCRRGPPALDVERMGTGGVERVEGRGEDAVRAMPAEAAVAAPVAASAADPAPSAAASAAPEPVAQGGSVNAGGAQPQVCSPAPAKPGMSVKKIEKHGHSWTFDKAKAALSGALGTAKELLAAGKVDKRKGPRTPEELKDPSYSFRDDPEWMNGGRVSKPKVEEVFQQPAGEPFVERIGEVVCRRRVGPGMPAGHWEGRRPYMRGQREQYAESNRDDPFADY